MLERVLVLKGHRCWLNPWGCMRMNVTLIQVVSGWIINVYEWAQVCPVLNCGYSGERERPGSFERLYP